MKITGKMTMGYVLVALLAVLTGYSGIHAVRVYEESRHVTDNTLACIDILSTIKFDGMRVINATNEVGFMAEVAAREAVGDTGQNVRELQQFLLLLNQDLQRYREMIEFYFPAERPGLDRIQKVIFDLEKQSFTLVGLIRTGTHGDTLREVRTQFDGAEERFVAEVDNAFRHEKEELEEKGKLVKGSMGVAERTIYAITGIILCLSLVLGGIISRLMAQPIIALKHAAEEVGRGRRDTTIDVTSGDEVGDLAMSFRQMLEDLQVQEAARRKSEEMYRIVAEFSSDMSFWRGPDKALLYVSPTCKLLTGYSEEDFYGDATLLDRLVHSDDGAVWENHTHMVDADGLTQPIDVRLVTKEGQIRWVFHSCHPVYSETGEFIGTRGSFADFSERKRTEEKLARFSEELQESNDELRAFAFIVSHDLRSPLVNIKGFAGEVRKTLATVGCLKTFRLGDERDEPLCLQREEQAEIIEALDYIDLSVKRMDTLIKAISDLSRLGMRQLKPEMLDMGVLVRHIIDSFTYLVNERSIRISLGEIPDFVADREAMTMVITNLLDNAIKYLEPSRPGEIAISGFSSPAGATVSVSDNGRGIASEDTDKVFDIFRRAGKADVPGEGIGLTYARTLVRRHAGHIWCESTPGIGSTFNVTIPLPLDDGEHSP